LGQGHLGDGNLETSTGVSSTNHLHDEADVTFGVAPVTAVTTLGMWESVPGFPHPQRGGHQARSFGKVADGQAALRDGTGWAWGLRFGVHPVIVNLNVLFRKVFNYRLTNLKEIE
jgi:hypothetical protein